MVEIRDKTPSLVEWAGGPDAFAKLTAEFYRRVQTHAVLAPVFAQMRPEHSAHVAAFIAEVLGGPKTYTAGGGSHAEMIRGHLGRHLTEIQRKAWMNLMLEVADDTGLPSDPEFRSAFVGYLEWGTRLAVLNSAPGASSPQEDAPMPAWNWGPPGGPYKG